MVELKAKIALAISRKEGPGPERSARRDHGHRADDGGRDGRGGVVLDFQRRMGHATPWKGLKAPSSRRWTATAPGWLPEAEVPPGHPVVFRVRALQCPGGCILDHLERQDGPHGDQSLGSNLSFNFGSVVVLVRNLMALPAASRSRLARKIGRIPGQRGPAGERRRVTPEGAGCRGRGQRRAKRLVAPHPGSAHHRSQRLAARQPAQGRGDFPGAVRGRSVSFIHLGLTSYQEEMLTETIRKHMGRPRRCSDRPPRSGAWTR